MGSLGKVVVVAIAFLAAMVCGTSIGHIVGRSSGALHNVTQRHGQLTEGLSAGSRSSRHTSSRRAFTADELINTRFPLQISDDIDLDPCKSVGLMGDIALPNVNYETQWQTQRLNKSFQQELERMKQEVYHEGLQVEEEGLTDIIRKKTKLPTSHFEDTITSKAIHKEIHSGVDAAIGVHKNDATSLDFDNNQQPTNPSSSRSTDAVSELQSEVNAIIIDNNSSYPYQTHTSITSNPVQTKRMPSVTHHVDQSKIQSDSKDIVYDHVDNIVSRIQSTSTSTIVTQTTDRLNQTVIDAQKSATTISPTSIPNRQHRRRRQGRKLYGKHKMSQPYVNYSKNLEISKVQSHNEEDNHTQVSNASEKPLNLTPHANPTKSMIAEIDEPIIQLMTSDMASSIPRDWSSTLVPPTSSLPDLDRLKELQHHHRVTRAATAKKERIWDYGVIPYEIDANFSGAHKALFKQAMRHWENFTCVKFVERNHNDHPNYIMFTIRPCGCCSFVGKRGNGGQAISIGKNCDKFGIVVHELGHVVGFWHEHTRPDRELHVVIERGNIMTGQDYNFNKLTSDDVNSLGLPYDYESIMHYARNTFSKGTFLDTIHPVDSFETPGKKRPEIGQRLRLSEGDIAQANLLYKCPKCGRTYQDNSASFTSPNYYNKNTVNEAESCEWRITATHGEKIVLNITELDIFKSNSCRTDYLEIRDGYWYKSPVLGRYCGSGRVLELIKSTGSRMLLTFVTSKQLVPIRNHRGFSAHYEAVCGGDLNLASGGRLESPNYPLDYLPNKECIWRITVEEEYQVALKFQSFEVENHDNCVYDYVEVRDGDSADSRLIGVYCGYKVPKDIRSTTNKIFVKFVSDSSVQKAGFSAIFVKELDECEMQNHGCEHECINTLGGYQCSCYIGYELHSDKKTCENACGGVIEALNGTFTSPSYPDLYPMSKECVWEILVPEQYRITLNFTQFDLEGNNYHASECDYDSVSVYSIVEEQIHKRHGTFCGSRDVPMITSEGNAMRIVFRSDHTIQRIGFSALFFTDIDECAVNNGGCMHECKNTIGSYVCSCHNGYILHENGLDCKEGGCKYEITAPNGQIYSPNYPESYPPRKDCVWHFSTTPGHRIRLTFTGFEMEPHQECTYDHIAIYDGDSPDSFTLGRFCGSKLPHPIAASSNEMFMVFKSDSSVQRGGFAATHSTACGGRLQATNRVQHFYSHSRFGDDDYNNNANCDWSIEASSGSNVQLTFLTFDIENEKNCSFDYVDVFGSLDDYNGPLYGRYCGSNKPPDIISANEALLVRFFSDGTMAFKGFSASYVAIDPFGSEELESSDSSEMITPFPGYLQSVIISAEEEDGDNDDDYNEFEHYKRPNNYYNHEINMEQPIKQI